MRCGKVTTYKVAMPGEEFRQKRDSQLSLPHDGLDLVSDLSEQFIGL